jgi:hypothetical protein
VLTPGWRSQESGLGLRGQGFGIRWLIYRRVSESALRRGDRDDEQERAGQDALDEKR